MNVDLWIAPAAPPSEGLLADLDDSEQARAAAISHPLTRRHFVAGHALLRRVLGRRLGLPPRAVPIDRACRHCGADDHGKPFVTGVDPPTVFSFSAASGVVAVAVASGGELGVDIEEPRPRGWLRDCPGAPSSARSWVRLEALLKATGHGLTVEPTALLITEEAGVPVLAKWPFGDPSAIRLIDFDATDTIAGCVALTARRDSVAVVVHRLECL